MNIQSTTHYSPVNTLSHQKQAITNDMENIAVSGKTIADTVSISSAAQNNFTNQSHVAKASESSTTATFNTTQGYKKMNIDELFSPPDPSAVYSLQTMPLLLPSKDNIDALTKHISAKMPQFLAENNIPSAPSSISYNRQGQIQLPSDYAYAPEFMKGLENNPKMARELSTVNALTSQYVEMQKLTPFHDAFANANSQAEIDAVIAKYNYLLSGNRQNSIITMNLSANGSLSLFADGKSVIA
ncbi:MAG: hypothetical protein Q9M16_00075 [Mariprofundus sp.]|nr:hypothetical protein [Mariprofundus sp.]